jgi:hypothetical protein
MCSYVFDRFVRVISFELCCQISLKYVCNASWTANAGARR